MDAQQPQTKIDWQKFKITRIARVNGCKAETPSGVVRFIKKRISNEVLRRLKGCMAFPPLAEPYTGAGATPRYLTFRFKDEGLGGEVEKNVLRAHKRLRVIHNTIPTTKPVDDGRLTHTTVGKWANRHNIVTYLSAIRVYRSGRAIAWISGKTEGKWRVITLPPGFGFFRKGSCIEQEIGKVDVIKPEDHIIGCLRVYNHNTPYHEKMVGRDIVRALWALDIKAPDAQQRINQLCHDHQAQLDTKKPEALACSQV